MDEQRSSEQKAGDYKRAKGVLQWDDDEKPEEAIRRLREPVHKELWSIQEFLHALEADRDEWVQKHHDLSMEHGERLDLVDKLEAKLEAMERLLDIERLANLEHEQWMAWSKAVAHEVSPERQKRWEALWVSYDYLTQQEREQDRIWARKILAVAQEETLEK